MSAALGLYRLQQIDSQIDHARSRAEIIQRTLDNDEDYRKAVEKTTLATSAHRTAIQNQKQAEVEVQSQLVKIEQAEASLYGGNVRNPKELQDLQRDVASLKKQLGILEDRLLETMLTTEESASSLSEAKIKLGEVESRLGEQTKSLTTERETINRALERFETERKAAAASIDGKSLEIYDLLRREKRGIAVTTVSDGACGGCGTTLTPSQQQIARSSREIFRCSTCGRILFAD